MTKKDTQPYKKRRIFLVSGVAVIILGIGLYVAYDLWRVEQQTATILRAPGIISSTDTTGEKSDEGSEATEITPAVTASYQVPPDAPRYLRINKLGVNARVQNMGLNSDKTIQAPKNIFDAGWYNASVKPGNQGAVFIDGHGSGVTRYGLFGSLDKLTAGDKVSIERGDGEVFNYEVIHVETVSYSDVDMNKALKPYPGTDRGLNLMSCTGVWVKDQATLDQRVIVYTKQV
ncbi:MAG: class F sortase [Candidatus Microsaccharimonas sp.]